MLAQPKKHLPVSATDIKNGAQAERLLPLRQETPYKFSARRHELGLRGVIEDEWFVHCARVANKRVPTNGCQQTGELL